MGSTKIKVSAPRETPHICYVNREYEEKIKDLKKATGMSLYSLIRTCSGYLLNEKEDIKNFKEYVRKRGFKNIGEWTECLIDLLHGAIEHIDTIDLTSITLSKEKEEN